MRFLFACLLASLSLGLTIPALAWEWTAEFRIPGDHLMSFQTFAPDGESPARIELVVFSQRDGRQELVVEADNGLGDCPQVLADAQDDPHVTVVITQHFNAPTLNGMTLNQCASR